MHTDQWRFDGYRADALASPLAEGHLAGMHTADTIAQSARLGWMPFYPQFDRNPLDLADEARAAVDTREVADPVSHVVDKLSEGSLDAPRYESVLKVDVLLPGADVWDAGCWCSRRR